MSEFSSRPRPEPDRKTGIAPNGRTYESVWSYPHPPEIRREPRTVLVVADGATIASSTRAIRVCETAGAPVVYVPSEDLVPGALRSASEAGSYCEWKGAAAYLDVVTADRTIPLAVWTYPRPSPGFEQLVGYHSFYPGLVECRLDDELVRPQDGGFYGGWITDEITGPIKGAPGTGAW